MRALFMTLCAACLVAACSDDPKTQVATGDEEVADASDVRDTSDTADAPETGPTPAERVMAIPESARFELPGLHGDVQVVRVESDIPHIHATDEHDLFLANGYVTARDRFLMMDVIRRAGRGRLTPLMGELALARDMEARGTGVTFVAETMLARFDAAELARVQAYCDGINTFIAAVKAGTFPVPSEYELMGPLLGADDPTTLMEDWQPIDVAAVSAFIVYYASFEGGDVGREAAHQAMPGVFVGKALEALRTAGLADDIVGDLAPLFPIGSAPGWGIEVGPDAVPAIDPEDRRENTNARSHTTRTHGTGRKKVMPAALLQRASGRLERIANRFYRDHDHDFGSNEWAVMGKHGKDGVTLLAADGHLALDIPAFFYQIGFDLSVFGDSDFRQRGLVIPGFPQLAVGTNGNVAWTQTQESGDITDWYREEIQLGADGEPAKSRFKGEWRDLVVASESYDVRNVAALGSIGRTETWKRWTTFDGRWLADIEGRPAQDGEPLAAGEAIVTMQGDLIVPGDTDGDGVITALSFDYTGLDMGNLLRANQAWGTSKDVWDFLTGMRFVTTYSQNMAAADRNGNILYSGYQTVPCRGYLPRDADGRWVDGADPNRVLDGTEYPGFTIPLDANQMGDEAPGASDPTKCIVPFDRYPQVVSPAKGYVANANNDPGGFTLDRDLATEEHWIGGPWDIGFRVSTISRELEQAIAEGTADVAKMAEIQGNHDSRIAELFLDRMLAAIDAVGDAPIVDTNQARIDEARARLEAWRDRGFVAESGVDTFYASPSAEQRGDAIATSVWAAWFPRVLQQVFDDEGVPGDLWNDGTSSGQVRLFARMVLGGADQLASYNAAEGESAFCDRLGTDEVESCDALIVKALVDALDFLAGPGEGDSGGFGTAEQDQWLWGLRHQVRFGSLLANQIGQNELFDLFLADFRVTTAVLPLAESYAAGDPRASLTWFPRPGDQWGVDAANPGFSGRGFGYSSGPVMRMVIGFLPDGSVVGQNIIPGGQSGRPGSPFFADQAALWLGNNTLPLRYSVADMVAGARGREVLTPKP